MSKGSSDPMQGLVANGRVEDVPDEGMQNYADAPAQGDGGGIGNKVVDNTAKLGNTFLDGLKSLGAMFAGPAAAVSMAASKVTGAVGRTLNIGQGASTVVSLALVAALAGTGAVGVASVIGNDDITTLYVGTVDCKKQIEEAKTKYGYGEREIPEEINGKPVGRSAVWENSMWWMQGGTGAGNRGTEDRRIVQDYAVESHGGDYDYYDEKTGIYTLAGDTDEYYLIAVAPAGFGRTETDPACVGDWITFYFEDGEAFETIVVDTKGNADDFKDGDLEKEVGGVDGYGNSYVVNGYGHVQENGTNCFEFTSGGGKYNLSNGWPNDTMASLGGKLGDFESFGHKGQRVASFTNHGLAPELESVMGSAYTGSLDMASSNQSSARSNGMGDAADECSRYCPKTYDNTGVAEAAMSLAYTCTVPSTTHQGTELLNTVSEMCEVDPVGAWAGTNCSWDSCDRGVCVCVRWGGADDNYPSGACANQITYLETQGIPDGKWMVVDDYDPGSHNFENILQPGDVFLAPNHTSVYVSEELIKEHEFDPEQDVGPVPDGAFSASASLGDRVLCITCDDGTDAAGIHGTAYRCIEPETDSKYADGNLGSGTTVAATMGCGDKYKKKNKSYSDTDFSDTLCIGDSVMFGCQSELESAMPNVTVNAVSNRYFDAPNNAAGVSDTSSIMDVIKSKASNYDRIVIGTGNNEYAGLSLEDGKRVVSALKGKDIWFITEYSGRNMTSTTTTNKTIASLASQYDNVHVIGWYNVASKHTDWLDSWQVHVDSDEGKEKYASLVKGSVGGGGTGGVEDDG